MTKVKLWILAITVVGVGAAATAGVLHMRGQELAAAPEATSEPTALQVKVVHPKRGVMERNCVQPGSTLAFESARLFAKVPGFLKSQMVDIGIHVEKGKELAFVDVPDIEANVERNHAAVEKATAILEQMKSRIEVAEANFEAVEAAVVQAEAKQKSDEALVAYRSIELGRIQELVKENSIEAKLGDQSRQHHASAVESERSSKAAIESARANVKAAKARIREARADVVEAEAEVKLARAVLKRSKVDLDFATIKAPFEGVVTHRFMNPGDFVKAADGSPNIEPLFTIDRTDLFRVVVHVPERDVRFINKKTTAIIELDALPGTSFPLRISRYSESLDRKTRLMRVEFDLKNNDKGQIYNDMYGKVTIVLEKGSDLMSIPSSCLATKPDRGTATVYVVRSGKAEKVDIKIVMDSGVRVAVEGLRPDDQVIINPVSDIARTASVNATLVKD